VPQVGQCATLTAAFMARIGLGHVRRLPGPLVALMMAMTPQAGFASLRRRKG
jgi:hypothetical protein